MNFPRKEIVNSKNPYLILDLVVEATEEEIRKSYRSLSFLWHPDKNPYNPDECKDMFIQVKWAYDILSNKEKRLNFDKFGTTDEDDIDELQSSLAKFGEKLTEDLSNIRSQNFRKSVKSGLEGNVKDLCEDCGGYGIKEKQVGFLVSKEVCYKCNGNGYVDAKPIADTYVSKNDRGYNYHNLKNPSFFSRENWWGDLKQS